MSENEYYLPPCCICRREEPLPAEHYFVYAIELSNETLVPSGRLVYVGQSWHTPECRFEQHKSGYKASASVREYGIRLVPELYFGLNPIISRNRTAALQAEASLAVKLRADGFVVISS